MQLNKAKALVTGAGKRIGRKIALSLAEEGADVVVHYRSSEDEAVKLKEELTEQGASAHLLRADLREGTELEDVIPRASEKAGRIDFLVNNAAVFPRGGLEELEFEELTENIRINSWAPFSLTRSFAEFFDSGSVVNLLDTRVAGYDWDHAGYYFSKVLLERMTKMMALKFAPGVAVNGVAPGLITPPEGLSENYLDERVERVPLEKHGSKVDVARAVVYLLKSDFVTGQILYVDGGRNLLHELEG
jgi:hypothetical protein